jgi:hypothetical protein
LARFCESESILASFFILADWKRCLYKEMTCHYRKEMVTLELWPAATTQHKLQNNNWIANTFCVVMRRQAVGLSNFIRSLSYALFNNHTVFYMHGVRFKCLVQKGCSLKTQIIFC